MRELEREYEGCWKLCLYVLLCIKNSIELRFHLSILKIPQEVELRLLRGGSLKSLGCGGCMLMMTIILKFSPEFLPNFITEQQITWTTKVRSVNLKKCMTSTMIDHFINCEINLSAFLSLNSEEWFLGIEVSWFPKHDSLFWPFFGDFLQKGFFWCKVAKSILFKLIPLFCFFLALAAALGCIFSLFSRFLKDDEEMVFQFQLIL